MSTVAAEASSGSDAPDDAATTTGAWPLSMSNTKAELVDAAYDDGLGSRDDLEAMTKQQILDLWS